jgi:hypothetical protein
VRWLPLALLAACDPPAPAAPDAFVNECGLGDEKLARPGDAIGGDTYETYAKGFFATWCTRCHSERSPDRMGAPADFDWDEEATVRLWLPLIRLDVASLNMPWTPPKPACDERRRLLRWIDAGGP